MRSCWKLMVLACASLALIGCETVGKTNASLPLTRGQAAEVLNGMEKERVSLERPVLVLSGFLDPGLAALSIEDGLEEVVKGGPVVVISFATESDFEGARETLIRELEEVLPSGESDETVEVDVIGHSMGGLIARYAAMPKEDAKRLKICRLFTLATPHRGAAFGGGALPINDLAADMGEGAEFIDQVNAASRDYALLPYVMLGDQVVGAENSAPPSEHPWWVDRRWFSVPHFAVVEDDRIRADIFARLRGDDAFATEPRADLP